MKIHNDLVKLWTPADLLWLLGSLSHTAGSGYVTLWLYWRQADPRSCTAQPAVTGVHTSGLLAGAHSPESQAVLGVCKTRYLQVMGEVSEGAVQGRSSEWAAGGAKLLTSW